jgi:hypothetical protein
VVGKETVPVKFQLLLSYFKLKLKIEEVSVIGIHTKFRETHLYLFANCYKQIPTDRRGDASVLLLETFVVRALEIYTAN